MQTLDAYLRAVAERLSGARAQLPQLEAVMEGALRQALSWFSVRSGVLEATVSVAAAGHVVDTSELDPPCLELVEVRAPYSADGEGEVGWPFRFVSLESVFVPGYSFTASETVR